MITLYLKSYNKIIPDADTKLLEDLGYEDILWIDMLGSTPKENKAVEEFLEINLQTRQQVEEIESSSRYSENENSVICNSNFLIYKDGQFLVEPVSFIVCEGILVSVRGDEQLKTFNEATKRFQMNHRSYLTGYHLLISLLEARIDLDADMVEIVSKQIATLGTQQYSGGSGKIDESILLQISRLQDNTMLLRENIFDRQRVLSGIQRSERFPNDLYPRVSIMMKDVGSLINHADFSFERLDFLQNTMLGLINVEQNSIIKIFTVLSVIFMPPTLIASLYGMNFRIMPELDWSLGYPYAITLMLASSFGTLYYFKRKKWL